MKSQFVLWDLEATNSAFLDFEKALVVAKMLIDFLLRATENLATNFAFVQNYFKNMIFKVTFSKFHNSYKDALIILSMSKTN